MSHPNGHRWCILIMILSEPTRSCLAMSIEKRISRLRPWSTSADNGKVILGTAIEERNTEEGSLSVSVRWKDQDSLTIELPPIKDKDSLAASLWPPSLAAAVLCRSPSVTDLLRGRTVLELGSGLGLTGLAAAESASSCHLTDNDEPVVNMLKDLVKERPNIKADYLEWRNQDRNPNIAEADLVLGSDVAYYFFLLRPLMDTTKAYLKPRNSVCLIFGQANRESQWDLYHNIRDGCYNQLNDKHESPWDGETEMLLYNLEMSDWIAPDASSDDAQIDGVIPVGVLIHQTPDARDIRLTEFDYVANADDEENMAITF